MANSSGPQGAAPGAHVEHSRRSYLIGLCYALILTGTSFWAASSPLVYGPADPVLLGVLAIAQMAVHLVFFLNISTAPDQASNFLTLAFGVFVAALAIFGSILIMTNLDHAMMPMDRLLEMQR